MTPLEPKIPAGEAVSGPAVVERPPYRWYHKLSAVVFVVFCLEIGSFLLIFPWTGYWGGNFFSTFAPGWRPYWQNAYMRGAVSGLGVVNLYISAVEIFRLRRFAKH
jgi:hypothetical protein